MRAPLNMDELRAIAFTRSAARDHIDYKGLASGQINGVHQASKGRKRDNVPDLDPMRKRDPGQNECKDHHGGLGGDKDFSPVIAVGQCAADGSQQENRNLRSKCYCPQ